MRQELAETPALSPLLWKALRERAGGERERELADVRVELAVAVSEDENALDVVAGFVEAQVLHEVVQLRVGAGLVPQPADAVGAAVVAGEGELHVAVEAVEELPEVGG